MAKLAATCLFKLIIFIFLGSSLISVYIHISRLPHLSSLKMPTEYINPASADEKPVSTEEKPASADLKPKGIIPRTYANILVPEKQGWLKVPGASFLVYSAYRNGGHIRVIGIGLAKRESGQTIYCHIYYAEAPTSPHMSPLSVRASVQRIPENHGFFYSATFLLCPINAALSQRHYIAVAFSKSANVNFSRAPRLRLSNVAVTPQPPSRLPLPTIPIQSRDNLTHKPYNFTLCVPPLHNNVSDVFHIVEWLELHRLLGIDHVVFYTGFASPDVRATLTHYARDAASKRNFKVSMLTWNIRTPITRNYPEPEYSVYYGGQLAAINDCVYRFRWKTEYLASYDLDEVIIPARDRTWSWRDMVTSKGSGFKDVNTVKQAFFHESVYQQTHNLQESLDIVAWGNTSRHLFSAVSVVRAVKVLPAGQRSKVLAKPECVKTLGVHQAWAIETGCQRTVVSDSVALLHHYRYINWSKEKTMNYMAARKYRTRLEEVVASRLIKIGKNRAGTQLSSRYK